MCVDCLIGGSIEDTLSIDAERYPTATTAEALDFGPIGTYPKTGIDVLIIGTGFAGLTAALEFTRKGHTVRILERHDAPDKAGTYVPSDSTRSR